MSKKKHEIIFQVPKTTIPPNVKALMDKAEERMKAANAAVGDMFGEPLEIDLLVRNDKVRFSMPNSKLAAPALAKSIIRAVQEYEVKALKMSPRTHRSDRLGEATITYDRCVRIDWMKKTIFTNFTPNEGPAFLGAMAIIVEELQGGSSSDAGETKS